MTSAVALCTYNGEQFLSDQLDSILEQSMPVDEIVVCDDCSTDNTIEILREYEKEHPEIIKIHVNEKNLGYVKNFEKAISLCTKDVIFLCDQDDVWKNDKVKSVVDTFQANPNLEVIAHKINLLLDDGSYVEKSFWNRVGFNPKFSNEEILKYILLEDNVFPGMSMCITQKAKGKYLPFKHVNSLVIHDGELVIRACKGQAFSVLDKTLASYRVHTNQNIGIKYNDISSVTFTVDEVVRRLRERKEVKEIVNVYGLPKSLLKQYDEKHKNRYIAWLNTLPPKNRIMYKVKINFVYRILGYNLNYYSSIKRTILKPFSKLKSIMK